MPKRWHIRPHDPAQIARLEREAGVSAVVAQLLIGRGICDPTDGQNVSRPQTERPARSRMNCRACPPPPIA